MAKVLENQAADTAGTGGHPGHRDPARVEEAVVPQGDRATLGRSLGSAQADAIERNEFAFDVDNHGVHLEERNPLFLHQLVEVPQAFEKTQQRLLVGQRLPMACPAEQNLAQPVIAEFLQRLPRRVRGHRPEKQGLPEFPRPVLRQHSTKTETDDGAAALVTLQTHEDFARRVSGKSRLDTLGDQRPKPVESPGNVIPHLPVLCGNGVDGKIAEVKRAGFGLVPQVSGHTFDDDRVAFGKRRGGDVHIGFDHVMPGRFDAHGRQQSVDLVFRDKGAAHREWRIRSGSWKGA